MRLYASLAAALLLAPNLFAQTISPQPTEGDNTVSIQNPGPTGGDTIQLKIFTPPLPKLAPILPAKDPPALTCSSTTAKNSADITFKAGTNPKTIDGNVTTVTLDKPLVGGSTICAIVKDKPGPAIEVLPPTTPPGFDWGLVRAYFTVGDLASQERDQFSHQDLFLAFRLDKTYIMPRNHDASVKHSYHPGLNTYFETRLTALPVAVQACNTSSTSCSNASSSSPGDTTTNPATIDTFLNSQKTARLGFGVYAPMLLHQWDVATRTANGTVDQPYALYVAPIIKTGFDTTLNGLNQTQQESTAPTTVQSIGGSTHFYKFYDFGFRLGHYALSKNPGTAHDQLSYLDVSWGRFGNLASLLCPATQYNVNNDSCKTLIDPTTNQPIPLNLAWHRDVRMNVEGLLEVPATHGFSIGFSTNVSYYPGSKKGADLVHIRPADDLRFLFAYKFDISKIAAKLAPGFGN